MTIYTDGVHLISDALDFDELHAFARRLGLRRSWFQGDHHDLTTRKKAAEAAALGAVLIDVKDLARLAMRNRALRAGGDPEAVLARWKIAPGWRPDPLHSSLAADKNTDLMRRFAPGRRIGRRGTDHLEGPTAAQNTSSRERTPNATDGQRLPAPVSRGRRAPPVS